MGIEAVATSNHPSRSRRSIRNPHSEFRNQFFPRQPLHILRVGEYTEAMVFFANTSPRVRRSVLALVMLGVLLASIAAAWMLARQTKAGPVAGEDWYLIVDGDNAPIGWMVRYQGAGGKLGLTGYEVTYQRALQGESPPPSWSKWELNPDATAGRYISVRYAVAGPGQLTDSVTLVDYNGRAVQVSNIRQGIKRILRLPAPADYIPKGRLIPTVQEVARTGQPFMGQMIQDELAAMLPVAIEPVTDGSIQSADTEPTSGPQGASQVVQMRIRGIATIVRYTVASDGTIPLIEYLKRDGSADGDQLHQTLKLVGFDAVTKQFSQAPAQKLHALRQKKFD